MTSEAYTADGIRQLVEADIERLFAPWALGRPENWSPDVATKLTVATGYWLAEELRRVCNETDAQTQIRRFNRYSRTYDIFESAAEVMNEAAPGKVVQGYKHRRRWGA